MKFPFQIVILLSAVYMSSSAASDEGVAVLENYADMAHAMYEDASIGCLN